MDLFQSMYWSCVLDRNHLIMKITRAVGLVLFLFIAQYLVSDIFSAFESAARRSLNVIEAAAVLSIERIEQLEQ